MVSRWLPPYYVSLGTDGFGRSDTRENLRALFEIDPPHIAAATLVGLVRCGALDSKVASKAIRELGLDPDKVDLVALRPAVRGRWSEGGVSWTALHRGPQP